MTNQIYPALVQACMHRHKTPDAAKDCALKRDRKRTDDRPFTYAYDVVAATWKSCRLGDAGYRRLQAREAAPRG